MNLIMLNGDERCNGEITGVMRNQKSTIDFVLINQPGYRLFIEMNIDEHKVKCDLSDHCLIETRFRITTSRGSSSRNDTETRTEYYKINSDDLEEHFLLKMEQDIICKQNNGEIIDEETLEMILKDNCEGVLKRTLKRKEITENGELKKIEPVWMTKNIKKEMKIRRRYNRERSHVDENRIEQLEEKYKEQKYKVQMMIGKEMNEYEKITLEVKTAKDKGKKMFEMIKKLKGNDKKDRRMHEPVVYEKQEKLSVSVSAQRMEIFWSSIYGKHCNNINEEWNDMEKLRYSEYQAESENCIMYLNKERGKVIVPWSLREHYDMVGEMIE